MTDVSEWLLRGHAAATIAFNDPIWAAQSHEMERGERRRGDYDPPLPVQLVDALRDRQKRLNALEDLMQAERRDDLPADADKDTWVMLRERFDHAGEELFRGKLMWVPKALVDEYRALKAAPLPCSADLIGARP
ncbi:hypothetical protein HY78_29135 (plasmid) [Rhizorhabdus wittichii DC-6]|nr:hypothetical protein HY78_29135 [Rhizorhabdus wittichii DC-6]